MDQIYFILYIYMYLFLQISNPSKYRVDLRFFAELISVGVIKKREGLTLLANQLGLLMNNDKEEHNNLSIVTSFCKHCGDDYAGLVSRKFRYSNASFNHISRMDS